MASLQGGAQQDRRPSPGLSINLSSNNPFRNPRTASPNSALSPAFPSPANAPAVSPRLAATNPFLAAHEQTGEQQTELAAPVMTEATSPQLQRSPMDNEAAQLFHRLTLQDSGVPGASTHARPSHPAPSGHKVSRSDEAERRRDPRMRPRRAPAEELDIFASPEKRDARRPRRNSESSVMSKVSINDEERRRRRRKEQEAREARSGSSKPRNRDSKGDKERDSSKPRRTRKPRGMDLIDQLDQTGIYGAGFIHHDGPFDAVNPHRNRRRDDRAPMLAFPTGSKNMMLGGSGPLNKGIDLERFHGVGAEGFTDFSGAAEAKKVEGKIVPQSFDPLARADPVHGEESVGLGTSTFLDGAPASRKAIMRRESETQADVIQGGIQRKKSLAQRIRGMSRREYGDNRPVIRGYEDRMDDATSPLGSQTPRVPDRLIQSAGGPSRVYLQDNNPFDTIYDDAFDKKGAAIKVAEQEKGQGPPVDKDAEYMTRARAPSSPRRNTLERRATADSPGDEAGDAKPSGFLNRVKSLKGGRRGRQPY